MRQCRIVIDKESSHDSQRFYISAFALLHGLDLCTRHHELIAGIVMSSTTYILSFDLQPVIRIDSHII